METNDFDETGGKAEMDMIRNDTGTDTDYLDEEAEHGYQPEQASQSTTPSRPSSLARHRLDTFSLSCGLMFAVTGVLALLQQTGAIAPSPGEVGAVVTATLAVIVVIVIAVVARRSLAPAVE